MDPQRFLRLVKNYCCSAEALPDCFWLTVARKYSREDFTRMRSPWQMVMIFSAILIEKIFTSAAIKGEVIVGRITS